MSFYYAPQAQNRAGQLFATGMSQGMDKMGRGIREYRRNKQEKEAADAAIAYGMEQGWFEDEAEGKAAVKAAGGGRAATSLFTQIDQQQKQQAAIQQRHAAEMALQKQRMAQAAQAHAAQALQKQAAQLRESQARMNGLGSGEPGSANADNYLRHGGQDAAVLGYLERKTRPQNKGPQLMTLGEGDNAVRGIYDGNNFSRIPDKKESDKPMSNQGKIHADAARLEKEGDLESANLLRESVKQNPQLGYQQTMHLKTLRDSVRDAGEALAKAKAELHNEGTGWLGGRADAVAEAEAAYRAAATELQETAQLFQDPFSDGTSAAPKQAAPAPAPNYTREQVELWLQENPNHKDAPAVREKLQTMWQ